LLTVSTIARLLIFAVCCAAVPVLRKREADLPALVKVPGGILIPLLALLLIAWLLAGSSWSETRDVVIAVAVGAMLLTLTRSRASGNAATVGEGTNART